MLIAYVFESDFGANVAGDTVTLEQDSAQPLVDAGILREATSEDVSGGDEEAEDTVPAETVQASKAKKSLGKRADEVIANIQDKIDSAALMAAKGMSGKAQRPSIPAQVKEPEFRSLGDFAKCVFRATVKNDLGAARKLHAMQQKAPTGMEFTDGTDGGYTVPVEYANSIWDKAREAAPLLERCTQHVVRHNTLKLPAISETSRADGSRFGGVRGYWVGEGNQITHSKPAFTQISLTLNKACVMVYATDELLSDSMVDIGSYISGLAGSELGFMLNNAILNGGGTTEPTGILAGSNGLVTVTKEGSQTAATVNYQNVIKMYSRLYGPSIKNAVWLINQEIYPQLFSMTFPNAAGTSPAYYPPGLGGGIADAPFGTLMGRPVYPIEQCAALGTVGDIVLADFSQFAVITKGGIDSAVSMHLHFDYHESVFRFTYRIDGKSMWTGALTPFKGSATQGPYVSLQTRS